jgi:MoaA/NifB/PqqE/SkfB family radical SAM enzyme
MDALARSLDMLVLSLDGPEASHDLVRKKRGSYGRVVEAIEAARSRGLAVATITVLSGANLHVMEEVLRLAEEHGFWAYFQPAYTDCFSHGRGLDPALGAAALSSIARDLERARDVGRPVGASPGFIERLRRGPDFGDCSSCNAGRYFGTVMPDGTVVPCHLVSSEARYPNGREIGFARAFQEMPHPASGPGCAISPYQESDLIFGLDPRAIAAAVQRLLPR